MEFPATRQVRHAKRDYAYTLLNRVAPRPVRMLFP